MRVEALPWAVGQQQFTRALLVTIATWTRVLPWQQVARLFGCAWGTVERAVEAAVVYGLAHRDLTAVTHIGIDEISRKQGHVYVTNVYDTPPYPRRAFMQQRHWPAAGFSSSV